MSINIMDILNPASACDFELNRDIDFKIVDIPIDDIVVNEDNFYSVDDVEELKNSIVAVGLQQNLTVIKESDKYRLLSGHRRFKALSELGIYNRVPCKVVNVSEIEERLILILSNSTSRVISDSEKMEQVRQLKLIGEDIKKSDNNFIEGRVRDFVAKILDISPTQVARFEAINNNLDEAIKEDFKSGKIGTSVAYETSKLDKDKQEEVKKFIDIAVKENKEVSIKDVKEIREVKEEKEEREEKEGKEGRDLREAKEEREERVVSDLDTLVNEDIEYDDSYLEDFDDSFLFEGVDNLFDEESEEDVQEEDEEGFQCVSEDRFQDSSLEEAKREKDILLEQIKRINERMENGVIDSDGVKHKVIIKALEYYIENVLNRRIAIENYIKEGR